MTRRRSDAGQVVLSGPMLELAEQCDLALRRLAAAWGAVEERHPPYLPVEPLHRLDYFRSFPHLATFPTCLDDADDNLAAFCDREPVADDGSLRPTELRPIAHVLTPAACYQLYIHHAGEVLTRPQYLTVRNTCFRREHEYEPLRRQWAFEMREIVAIGSSVEVTAFLDRTRRMVDELLLAIGLPIEWKVATDPFFRPTANARYLLQRVAPTKHEAVFGGDLAIASVNLHHDHFGATFDLRRDGVAASSGCVAFGLERWLYAITARFGTDPAEWPAIADAADRVTAAEVAR